MYDSEMMLTMSLGSINLANKGFDIVWDDIMFRFMINEFKDGIIFADQLSNERGLKLRLILEVTKENLSFLESLQNYEIRHLSDLRGNFGIFDSRAYMVQIFNQNEDKLDQTLWSNSKVLVDKQQTLFDKLWIMAKPLAIRRKEIEYEDIKDFHRMITHYQKILDVIHSLFLTCNNELTIFSSNKILCNILNKNNFVNRLPVFIERNLTVKILTDNIDEHLIKQINSLNKLNPQNPIQLGYYNKIGELNELIIFLIISIY
jgi:hypothetical protein